MPALGADNTLARRDQDGARAAHDCVELQQLCITDLSDMASAIGLGTCRLRNCGRSAECVGVVPESGPGTQAALMRAIMISRP